MTTVSFSPDPPTADSQVTITVDGCPCRVFTIKVVQVGAIPPSVLASSGPHTNPPAAELTVLPGPGNFRVDIFCNGNLDSSHPFSAS